MTDTSDDLVSGASVLVTAGAGGAGLVIARRFAASGARVAVCDIDRSAIEALESESPGLLCYEADVSDEGEVDRVFSDLDARRRAVDVVVNNVGIAGPTAAVEDIALEDWERSLRINLTSFFLTIRRATPAMKARGRGAIINISSQSVRTGLPLRLPYVVTKGAVLSMTRNLARELGPSGIRVNAILPGAIRGERLSKVIADKASALGQTTQVYEESMLQYVSLRTMVEPDDIANMALFLASGEGARISGQLIGVDGNVEYEV